MSAKTATGLMTEQEMIALLASEGFAAIEREARRRARAETIEECAQLCDQEMQWHKKTTESEKEISAENCARAIRAHSDKPSQHGYQFEGRPVQQYRGASTSPTPLPETYTSRAAPNNWSVEKSPIGDDFTIHHHAKFER